MPQDVGQKELLDARSAIGELTASNPDSAILEKEIAFMQTIRDYIAKSPGMAPEDAATKWLGLIDAGRAVPRRPLHNGANPEPIGTLTTVVGALPRPEVWPEITRIVSERQATRQNKVLLLLFARLRGDEKEVLSLCQQLSKVLPGDDPEAYQPYQRYLMSKVTSAALQRTRSWDPQLRLFTEGVKDTNSHLGAVPDVASLLGPAKAKSFLLELFSAARTAVYIESRPTRELARQVVVANLAKIKRPPWELADEMNDLPYVEKLVAHYGIGALVRASNEQEAAGVYLGGLMVRGDLKGAAAFLKKLQGVPNIGGEPTYRNYPYYARVPSLRFAGRLFKAVEKLQALVPGKDLWDVYVISAKASGNAAVAAKRISAIVYNPKTEPARKALLLQYLVDLHSSLGDVRAVAADYQLDAATRRMPGESPFYPHNFLKFATTVGDPKITQTAIELGKKGDQAGADTDLMDALASLKQFRVAEELQMRYLSRDDTRLTIGFNGNVYATRLCRLYYQAGRPQDIVTILRDFAYWSSDDLGKVLSSMSSHGGGIDEDNVDLPLGYYAAWAFAKTGQEELAGRVLRRLLLEFNHCDEAYALLNSLGGDELVGFYDQLYKSEPGQARPLIWKGALLQRLGRLVEAEKCVRDAIGMDPSDGKAGAGRRFKAYEILGVILRAKGDTAGAVACQNKVRAARLAEKGDAFTEVELLPQAIKYYEVSVKASPSDYVVEEKLAACLDAVGRPSQATVHHRRAFELLLRGFGPATVLAKSCEQMFDDEEILKIGAPVLARLGTDSPASAYLSAHYKEALGKPREAVGDLRKAVTKDPNFGVAWKMLAELGQKWYLSQAETEAANYAVLRLDSRIRGRLDCDFEQVSDLRVAYRAVESAIAKTPRLPTAPLFPLRTAVDGPRGALIAPWLYYSPGPDNPVGGYFIQAEDVREIISGYGGRFEFGGEN